MGVSVEGGKNGEAHFRVSHVSLAVTQKRSASIGLARTLAGLGAILERTRYVCVYRQQKTRYELSRGITARAEFSRGTRARAGGVWSLCSVLGAS